MGFESSRVARRRLASLAATNERVLEALSPSSFPGLSAGEPGVYPALVAEPLADMVDRAVGPAAHRTEHPTAVSAGSATNGDRKSTRLNSSHSTLSRMPSSA